MTSCPGEVEVLEQTPELDPAELVGDGEDAKPGALVHDIVEVGLAVGHELVAR